MQRAIIMTLAFSLAGSAATAAEYTLRNITQRTYENEVTRLPVDVTGTALRVLHGDTALPSLVDADGPAGTPALFIRTTIGPGEAQKLRIVAGEPPAADSGVTVRREGDHVVLDNGRIAVRLPGTQTAGAAPAPILAVRVDGRWVGAGAWDTALPLRSLTTSIVDTGRVMGRVRMAYAFEGNAGVRGDTPAFAELVVSLHPDQPVITIDERHAMPRGSAWTFEATAGWDARNSVCEYHGTSFAGGGRDKEKAGTLQTGQVDHQPDDFLASLFPRWNQHYKDGWFAGAHDGEHVVGALTVLAARWYWPHDNAIRCSVRESADTLIFRMPTYRGARHWRLLAGPLELATGREEPDPRRKGKTRRVGDIESLAKRIAYESLDTIVHDVPVNTWPEVDGSFKGYWPLDNHINPTGAVRGWGKMMRRETGKPKNNFGHLTQMQVLFAPNTYGSYWLFWSPENPNFFTDFNKVPILMASNLKAHPEFETLAAMAEARLREDMYHAITLPSGAGNECPGYQQYAMHHYLELAEACRKHLGFDPRTWPRFKAGARFQVRISQPMGNRRGAHPGGDTHPPYVLERDPRDFAAEFGVKEDVRDYTTEELQGFGVVFRNRPGTDRETYLAFKSGPSRGHYHGDQLSFHYGAHAQPLAVDHRCSYHPRAGQEHMHNRLAFFTKDLPHANMDGYERVIAFKTGTHVDVAVGQVESWRLRRVAPLPPENWHEEYPQVPFEEPLRYRRTIVQVRGGAQDYFVIRDQYTADRELGAAWCLHVYGDEAKLVDDGRRIDFGSLQVAAAAPADFEFANFDWSHENGGGESTRGCRLTTRGAAGEYITVLVPGGSMPDWESVPGGVRVGEDTIVFGGGIDDEHGTTYVTATTRGETLMLTGADIDMDRDQGDVGLFVPDAGYPFGEIPAWLAAQRVNVPDWAPEWVNVLRASEP